jgi:hypothetical protein
MHPGTTTVLSPAGASTDEMRELARQLRLEAEAVEAVRERLRGAVEIDWESPAGRNFRSYLAERAVAVGVTAFCLRDAAVSLDAYGAALSAADARGIYG